MRKLRNHRAPAFTKVDNSAIDDRNLAVPDIGLLTILLRCMDGYQITVEEIYERHNVPGRRGTGLAALEAAMRNLVQCAYVVKFKIQGPRGLWSTAVTVYDTPATLEEVQEVIAEELETDPEVRSYRIEPEWLDPRKDAKPQVTTDTPLKGGRSRTDMPLRGGRSADPRLGAGSTTDKKREKKKEKTAGLRPSVRPQPDAKTEPAPAEAEGRTEGRTESTAPSTIPTQPQRPAPVTPATEGAALLAELGQRNPLYLLTGHALADQTRNVDGLLASGWSPDDVRRIFYGRPLPLREEIKRTPGAVISARLTAASRGPAPSALPKLPSPAPAPDNTAPWHTGGRETGRSASAGSTYTPPPISQARQDTPRTECEGNEANGYWCPDGRLPVAGTSQCGECAGWDRCPCEKRYLRPGTHWCDTCSGHEPGAYVGTCACGRDLLAGEEVCGDCLYAAGLEATTTSIGITDPPF